MYFFFDDQHKYLYHYTSSKIATDNILSNKTLKIGRYIETNDPKETKEWQFFVGTNEGRELSPYNLTEMSIKATHALKHRTNVICFSCDRELSGDHMVDIFNRGFCKPKMWAQYAENHKGVCLIFDKEALSKTIMDKFSSDFLIYSGHVTYENRIIIETTSAPYGINVDYLEGLGFEEYIKAHIETHHKRLFFEKSKDWSNEDEFRWVLFGNMEEDIYFNFGSALAGIVFGADCQEDVISTVVKKCKGQNVQFQQMVWKNCTPWFSSKLIWE